MRGDLLQGAGGGKSGCLQAFDDSLDISHARLEGVDLSPQAFQLLGKDFALAASGSHDGEADSMPALAVLDVLDPVALRQVDRAGSEVEAAEQDRRDVGTAGLLGERRAVGQVRAHAGTRS